MIHYDFKPSKLEANGNGSYTYRWDIQEVQVENHFGEAGDNGQTTKWTLSPTHSPSLRTTKWTCNEVVVWGMVTNDKLKKAVITHLWDSDKEAKIINDYNAAQLGILTEKSATDDYKEYLQKRKAIKEMIDSDCKELNIIL